MFLASLLRLQSLEFWFTKAQSLSGTLKGLELNELQKLSIAQVALSNVRAYETIRSVRLETALNVFLPSSVGNDVHMPLPESYEGLFYFVIHAMEVLFDERMEELLGRFSRFDKYEVFLYDAQGRGEWWIDEIRKRMPVMSRVVHLHVEPFGNTPTPRSGQFSYL